MRDIAHGNGEALHVGDTVLEVYRDAGFARVTTPDARIELYRVPRYSVSGERVVFEQGEEENRSRLQAQADSEGPERGGCLARRPSLPETHGQERQGLYAQGEGHAARRCGGRRKLTGRVN